MKWAKVLFGLMVFVLAIACPQQLVSLFLSMAGLSWLEGTWVSQILSNIVAGSAFTAGLSWLVSGLKSIARGGSREG